MHRVIMHVDMDAFYASVEQMDDPSLAGKPVIVGADPMGGSGRGVVSTASYEARKYGIHSAMPISIAYRLCPKGVFLPVRGSRYKEMSDRIIRIFALYAPVIETLSLDEAFLDMSGMSRLVSEPIETGKKLKHQVWKETGLTASVGIGPNKLVAKIASDIEKPDGLVMVPHDQAAAFLASLPVTKLWGIGKKTALKLSDISVHSVGELARYNKKDLIRLFGPCSGESLWKMARGIDDSPVIDQREAKSISNEITFPKDVVEIQIHKQTLQQLSEKVGYRLRSQKMAGKTIFIKVRLSDFHTYLRHITLSHPTDDSEIILSSSFELYRSLTIEQPIRLLGVGVTQLSNRTSRQGSFFDEDKKKDKITSAVDRLKDKYGERVIRKGGFD